MIWNPLVSYLKKKIEVQSSDSNRGSVWFASTIKFGNEFGARIGEEVGEKFGEYVRAISIEYFKVEVIGYFRARVR